MPDLIFKGKEFVHNHHLAVPVHPLVPNPAKSIGTAGLDGNLVIHGDNLYALKALLPLYAGRVDCVFIDPPYNTGNEGWTYNDNVNSPMLRAWLTANAVGIEDGLRHDKWLAMMLPRLKLIRELMSETGSLWVTLDDNEASRARMLLDEVFGADNFVATFIWRKVDSPHDNKASITPDHDYVLCYALNAPQAKFSRLVAPSILEAYSQKSSDGRLFRDRLLKKNGRNSLESDRPTMAFGIDDPDGNKVFPIHENGERARWSMGPKAVEEHRIAGTLIWKKRQKLGCEVWEPYTREFAPDDPIRPYPTIWSDLATMRQAKTMLRDMFGTADLFATPKPVDLVRRVLDLACDETAIVLDCFAGSGTTGHAVLAANARDGGTRRFILVESEDFADSLTAERLRRVTDGFAFSGTQRKELLREPVTWTTLKKAAEMLRRVETVENLEGRHFDEIEKKVKDGVLTVTGLKRVPDRAAGLGGAFTFCTLGPAPDLGAMLAGEDLPAFEVLGAGLFHAATHQAFDLAAVRPPMAADAEGLGYLGETPALHVWMLYRPEKAWLASPAAALTLARARDVAARRAPGKRHLVFAATRFVPQRVLDAHDVPVEFAPLPFRQERPAKRAEATIPAVSPEAVPA